MATNAVDLDLRGTYLQQTDVQRVVLQLYRLPCSIIINMVYFCGDMLTKIKNWKEGLYGGWLFGIPAIIVQKNSYRVRCVLEFYLT